MQHNPYQHDPDEHDARLLLCEYIPRELIKQRQLNKFPGYALSSTTASGEPCLHLFITPHQVEITMCFGKADLPTVMDIPRKRWFEYVDPTAPGEQGYWRIEDGHQQEILTEFLRAWGRWMAPSP